MTELIEKGGFMMYPIMLSSVIAFAVFIERLFVFASVKLPKKEISDEFLSSLEKDGVKGGISFISSWKGAFKDFLAAVLNEKSEESCEKAASSAGDDILFNLNRRLDFLSMLGSVTPLMGLLGTVIGMIKVFSRVAAAGEMSDISILAGGIWEALLTTAAGLAVAIPILFAHNYLERKLDKITHLMMQTAQKTVALMKAGDFK
ncbi:MotA/TolQ/ExbB proton channel family protein [bacterium]|nr:MotA/TolQ/ExbB proton channel family protein [bacterium]